MGYPIRRGVCLRGFILLNLCGMSEVDGSRRRRLATNGLSAGRDARAWSPFIPNRPEGGLPVGVDGSGFRRARCREFRLAQGRSTDGRHVPQVLEQDCRRLDTEVLGHCGQFERGAQDALGHGRPDLIGFPFSISETFQQRNTGGGIEEGWRRLEEIRDAVDRAGRRMVVYLSMGFGNPYGDPWSEELAANWADRLHRELGVEQLALSDTVGKGDAQVIEAVCASVTSACQTWWSVHTFTGEGNKPAR